MRDQEINAPGCQLVVGVEADIARARIELSAGADRSVSVELAEGTLLMAIEALAMAYAELCGARPDSLARGVNRTLRNRTAAARERRAGAPEKRTA